MVLRRVKDRLGKFNVAVAEVEHQDVWQRAGARHRRHLHVRRSTSSSSWRRRPTRSTGSSPGSSPALKWSFWPSRRPDTMAQGYRPHRVGDQIREELSAMLARGEVHDPKIGFITLTRVQVSPDLQVARVYYTSLGDAAARKDTAERARPRHAVPAAADRQPGAAAARARASSSASTSRSRTRTASSRSSGTCTGRGSAQRRRRRSRAGRARSRRSDR